MYASHLKQRKKEFFVPSDFMEVLVSISKKPWKEQE